MGLSTMNEDRIKQARELIAEARQSATFLRLQGIVDRRVAETLEKLAEAVELLVPATAPDGGDRREAP